jgi:hypothetical protein
MARAAMTSESLPTALIVRVATSGVSWISDLGFESGMCKEVLQQAKQPFIQQYL